MSTIMDPAKLKVVELRAELSSRGLDTKGNKPVLVKRLREALEAESGNDLPDTSIADTSTEDLSTFNVSSQSSSLSEHEAELKEPERKVSPEFVKASSVESPTKSRSRTRKSEENNEKTLSKEEPVIKKPEVAEKMDTKEPEIESAEEIPPPAEPETASEELPATAEAKTPEKEQEHESPQPLEELNENEETPSVHAESEMNVDNVQEPEDVEMTEDDSNKVVSENNEVETEKDLSEPRNRKSRWGSVSETEPTDSGGQPPNTDPLPSEESGVQSEEPRGEKRRHGSPSPERATRKRSRSPVKEDEPEFDVDQVQLSWIDSDLNLQVDKECFTIATPMHSDGFGYMWAGVRSTHGINNGKVWYEVKLLENCDWKEAPREDKKSKDKDKAKEKDTEKTEESDKIKEEAPVEPTHVFRVGWSLPSTYLQLGEQPHSYGYDSEGFSVTDSQFTELEKKYSTGDVIGAFLNIDASSITISFTINGELQPTAFTVERSELSEDFVLFPHILTRNIKFEVNFGQKDEPWFQPPSEFSEFIFLKDAEDKITGLTRPASRKDCEIVMMVGLPCSGKSYWVNNHLANNPEKKYNVLGLGAVLDKMKYRGKSRKNHFKGSTTILMDKCTRCLAKLVDLASTKRRNYIIDQTNLFSSAQRRKLRPFDGFRRQAVVIVVADDEQSTREKSRQQADGKDVPDSAVLEMKANMCLPTVCDWLDEVTYAELDETKAKEIVQKYNKQGREAGYGPNYTAKQHSHNQKSKGGNDKRGQWGRNNKRDNNRDNRSNRWSGGGHNRQNNWGGNRGSGGWGRHDNRNQHHGGRGGEYRNNSNNRMISGGGYNRNQGGGYNRNRNAPPHRNPLQNKGGSWGGQGGGNWNQGLWGNQGWGGHQSGGQGVGSGTGWSQGSWGQYGSSQAGGSGGGGSGGTSHQSWKANYNAQQQYPQQQQQPSGYTQGYVAGQYGQGQYANWNYYGQYAQGWNTQQGQQGSGGANNDNNTSQYNQYTQQQQAAWAQYSQTGYGAGYSGQTSQGSAGTVTGGSSAANQNPAAK